MLSFKKIGLCDLNNSAEKEREREFMVIWFSYSLHAYRSLSLSGSEPVRLTVVPQGVTLGWVGGWVGEGVTGLSLANENCVKIKSELILKRFVNCPFA